jgi:hypothetical protein
MGRLVLVLWLEVAAADAPPGPYEACTCACAPPSEKGEGGRLGAAAAPVAARGDERLWRGES